ncbi:hypothetical protein SAMN04488020_10974 [Palleronia marisminoris]|uniref:hypothetical protein n=1 Tax=Palleronia marisminoris TaxID=315423 RepID=UPI0008F3F8A0|nr:hypothetical protein [Palleronia marisminoris]SFH27744.1 hypothetical protein SAMN04488020_10974 [Palleronia marisminoris]
MGEGLYWSRDGRTAYAEPFGDDLDPEDTALWDWAYDDLVATVRASVSAAWWPVRSEWRDRNSRIVARNGLHEIWLTGDSYNRVHITFGVRQHLAETEALALHSLDARADAFFDAVSQVYALHVRTSAWTSAPRETRKVAA